MASFLLLSIYLSQIMDLKNPNSETFKRPQRATETVTFYYKLFSTDQRNLIEIPEFYPTASNIRFTPTSNSYFGLCLLCY